jgi:hypothetical protein
MLEQIDTTAEDQLKTQVIVALGLICFGLFVLAGVATAGWTGMTMVGVVALGLGASMLRWTAQRTVWRMKKLSAA